MLEHLSSPPAPAAPPSRAERAAALDRFGVIPWILLFVALLSGAAVAVLVWTVAERFLSIIILLLTGLLIAFLLGPLVSRLEKAKVPRIVSILLIYIVVLGGIGVGITLLTGPLTLQFQGLSKSLPSLLSSHNSTTTGLDRFFTAHHIGLNVASLRARLGSTIADAGTTLLNSTLSVVLSLVGLATNIALILVITFYFLLDGRAMHNRAVRLLPSAQRERWFFIEATLASVVGGYIRGQVIVATSVGLAAGVGCVFLGVQYPIVIGLLAFLFEFIPLIGPVLGMVPAVIIALFQPFPLVLWVVVFFIVLQQVESNLLVPRVSGHAVGLHPLGALVALLGGVEIGGLGGALLAVPLAGVCWVIIMAVHADVSSQSELLVRRRRSPAYVSMAQRVIDRRRARSGKIPVVAADVNVLTAAPPLQNERLAEIAEVRTQLIEQFEADEAKQAVVDAATEDKASDKEAANGPDDLKASTAV